MQLPTPRRQRGRPSKERSCTISTTTKGTSRPLPGPSCPAANRKAAETGVPKPSSFRAEAPVFRPAAPAQKAQAEEVDDDGEPWYACFDLIAHPEDGSGSISRSYTVGQPHWSQGDDAVMAFENEETMRRTFNLDEPVRREHQGLLANLAPDYTVEPSSAIDRLQYASLPAPWATYTARFYTRTALGLHHLVRLWELCSLRASCGNSDPRGCMMLLSALNVYFEVFDTGDWMLLRDVIGSVQAREAREEVERVRGRKGFWWRFSGWE